MEPSAAFDSKLSDIRKFLEAGDFQNLEDSWMELVGSPEEVAEQLGGLLEVARDLAARGEVSRAAMLAELLAPSAREAGVPEGGDLLELHALLVRLSPGREEHREAFAELFETVHAPNTPERAYYEACAIREASDPAAAVERLERLSRFQPGAVVYHGSGWGMGEVLEVDPLLRQVRVDLAEKRDHRIAIDAVDSILEIVPDGSFRALLYRGSEELSRLAREDPVALFEKVLDDFGNPLALKDAKAQLVPDVVSPGSWSKWWTSAKKRLRESGYFRVGDRSPFKIERRERQLSYEDDLLERFRSGGWPEREKAARLVLKGGPDEFPQAFPVIRDALVRFAREEGEAHRMAERERGVSDASAADAAQVALVAAALLARNDPEGEGASVLEGVLERLGPDLALEVVEGLGSSEDVRAVVAASHGRDEGPVGREFLRRAFLSRSDALREGVAGRLERHDPERLQALAEEVVRSPRTGPEAFCWIAERRMKGQEGRPALDVLSGFTDSEFLGLVMDLLDHMVDRSARQSGARVRDVFRRLEGILFADRGAFFRGVLQELSAPTLRGVHAQLARASDLLPRYGLKLIEILSTTRPEVTSQDEDEGVWWSDDHIYVTEAGLERRRAEFRTITDEKLPEVVQAIGKAAEFGDLSENAEYTSALEERDMLTQRASAIEKELGRARLIRPEDIPAEGPVGIGHRIRLRDLDAGQELVYDILGPWDGRPEDGVINYLSPLGEIFLGRRTGERFTASLPGGETRYELLEVRSAFEDRQETGARDTAGDPDASGRPESPAGSESSS